MEFCNTYGYFFNEFYLTFTWLVMNNSHIKFIFELWRENKNFCQIWMSSFDKVERWLNFRYNIPFSLKFSFLQTKKYHIFYKNNLPQVYDFSSIWFFPFGLGKSFLQKLYQNSTQWVPRTPYFCTKYTVEFPFFRQIKVSLFQLLTFEKYFDVLKTCSCFEHWWIIWK